MASSKQFLEYSKNYKNNINSNNNLDQQSNKSISNDSYNKEKTIKCQFNKNGEPSNNNDNEICTLTNINKNMSKRIKKRLKKRKKNEKLKKLFELRSLKMDKMLLKENQNSNEFQTINQNKHHYSFSSSNKKISQILETTSRKNNSTIKTNYNFDENSLKKTPSISFEIKSSYLNINILSEGEMIKNNNFKNHLENLITKIIKKNKISNFDSSRQNIFFTSYQNKINSFKRYLTEKKHCNFLEEKQNKFPNENDEKEYEYFYELKKNWNNSGKFEDFSPKKDDKKKEISLNNLKNKKEKNKNSNNEIIHKNIKILNLNDLNLDKKEKMNIESIESNKNINDRVLSSTLNAFNQVNKDNKIAYLNQKNNNINIQTYVENNINKPNNNYCYIY